MISNNESMEVLKDDLKSLTQQIHEISHLKDVKDPMGIQKMRANALTQEKQKKLAELAYMKETYLKAQRYYTPRAYKELPYFFKFCLFKPNPRRQVRKEFNGETYIKEIKSTVDFKDIQAEITYYSGELGDRDRMVFLAVINEAKRHQEFVEEFKKIPFTLDEIANKAGFPQSGRRRQWVFESLERLYQTDLLFKNTFGKFKFKDHFRLLERHTTIEKIKVSKEINKRVKLINESKLLEQSETMLAKFKPRTHKLTLVKFNEPLMDAILDGHVTTIDMWSLQHLKTANERTFYLYLYDISQWRHSSAPLEIKLTDIITLLDLKPHIITSSKGKEYTNWKRTKDQIDNIISRIGQIAKFIVWHEWEGEKKDTFLKIKLSNEVLQIPLLID